MLLDHPSDGPTAIRTHIAAIFVSLELSRSTWLVTALSPGKGGPCSNVRTFECPRCKHVQKMLIEYVRPWIPPYGRRA